MQNIVIDRLPPVDEHDRQKWVRLIGRVDGTPESTWKTRTVNVAAIVAGQTSVEVEKLKLSADVTEYYARWLVLEGMQI